MTDGSSLHDRDIRDDKFYEWLLSDHPDAHAERDRRRTATYEAERDRSATVLAWVDKIDVTPDAPKNLRDLAATMRPLAAESAARAETKFAEPDSSSVARARRSWESHMQVSGPPGAWDYRYPAHLTGPEAAKHPAPEPQPDEPEAAG